MKRIFYSVNNEDFRFHEIEEALEYATDDTDRSGEIIIYEGQLKTELASHYFRCDPLEYMRDNAFDEVGECCDEWPDITNDQDKELEDMIKAVIDQWATKHELHPRFGLIENVKERTFVELNRSEYFDMENFHEVEQ